MRRRRHIQCRLSNAAPLAIWSISAATIAAILLRPARIAEWIWSLAGALLLVAAGLLPASSALHAAADGLDVYLFLAGMLALAELARIHGVFDWLAGTMLARGGRTSARRVLTWVYAAGIAVTALLSNDGTILLLTPAALAVAQQAGISPLPLLFACAFVANAASFVLPIANPANLVVFRQLPELAPWFAAFGLPSLAAVLCTYAVLLWGFRTELGGSVSSEIARPALSRGGKAAFFSVTLSAAVVVVSAALGRPVGATACIFGAASTAFVALFDSKTPLRVVREGSWSIVPLVAGLFVIVRALDNSGVLTHARAFFQYAGMLSASAGDLLTGSAITLADNLLNNLPVGVVVRYALAGSNAPAHIAHAALIGVDLGPNLSLSGSLATLLWLMILRRENIQISALQFLRMGALVTVPSLLAALLCVR